MTTGITMGEVTSFIISRKTAEGRAASTIASYLMSLTQFFSSFEPDRRVETLTFRECQDYVTIFATDHSALSVQNLRKRVIMAYNVIDIAGGLGYDGTLANPMTKTVYTFPKAQNRTALTPKQYFRLFEVAESRKDTLFLQWIFAGIRMPSEYITLTHDDILMASQKLNITRHKTFKHGISTSRIPMLNGMHATLEAEYADGGDNIFPYSHSAVTVTNAFKRLAKLANIPKHQACPYIGRNTIATKMAAEISTSELLNLMGWSSDQMMRTYVSEQVKGMWEELLEIERQKQQQQRTLRKAAKKAKRKRKKREAERKADELREMLMKYMKS